MQTKNNNKTFTIPFNKAPFGPKILKIWILKFYYSGLLWITNNLHVAYCKIPTIIIANNELNIPSFMNKIGKTIIAEPIIVFAIEVITLIEESVACVTWDILTDLIALFFSSEEICLESFIYDISALIWVDSSSIIIDNQL